MTTQGGEPFAGFDALLARALRDAERHRKRLELSPGDAAEEAFGRFEKQADLLADATAEARAAAEATRFKAHLDTFRAVDTVIGVTWAALRWIETSGQDSGDLPRPVRYATAAIGTRAISTAHEIFALIRAGFGNGARARWRTLYEIDVVAAVLAMGNRGTAARYVNHRWIELASRPHDYVGPDQPEFDRYARRQANLYLRRYGQAFAGRYGWASEITNRRLGIQKPKLYHLERLASAYLSDHSHRVIRAHQIIHASSVGALDSVDASGHFHAGANDANTDALCADLIWLLTETLTNLIRSWRHYEAERTDLELLESLVLEVGLLGHRHASAKAQLEFLTS